MSVFRAEFLLIAVFIFILFSFHFERLFLASLPAVSEFRCALLPLGSADSSIEHLAPFSATLPT